MHSFRSLACAGNSRCGNGSMVMILLDDDAVALSCSDWLHQLTDDSLPGCRMAA